MVERKAIEIHDAVEFIQLVLYFPLISNVVPIKLKFSRFRIPLPILFGYVERLMAQKFDAMFMENTDIDSADVVFDDHVSVVFGTGAVRMQKVAVNAKRLNFDSVRFQRDV